MSGNIFLKAVVITSCSAAAWLFCGHASAADIKAGDEVVTVCQTEIQSDIKPLLILPAGCYLKVQEIKGDLISVTVAVKGRPIAGTVPAKHVQALAEDQRPAGASKQSKAPNAAGRAAARQLITAEMIDAQNISNAEDKVNAYIGIACDQALAGDLAGAKATAARIIVQSKRAMAYWAIAYRQVNTGDAVGARQTLELAKTEAAQISDDFAKASALRLIARVQASAGDAAAAKATAAQIGDQKQQSQAYFAIAETQMKAGDWAGAKTTAALISDESLRILAQDEIVAAEAKAGGVAAVFKFIAAATSDPRVSCELLSAAAAELFR